MDQVLYTSSEVREILDISQRRMTHFAEKGLIIPVEDAKGAGSKRLYNYLNLLEFALCEMLFEMELGIHLVKRIISDLRECGEIKDWASNDLHNSLSVGSKIYDETDKKNKEEISSDFFPVDIEICDSTKSRLYYIFASFEALSHKRVIRIFSPLNLDQSVKEFGKQCFDIEKEISECSGMIMVNMDLIKQRVDEGIKKGK